MEKPNPETCSKEEWIEFQKQETVEQSMAGIPVRLGTITCRCGWERGITMMYRCLYCGEWFCELCAEKHFGKTREEYQKQKVLRNEK